MDCREEAKNELREYSAKKLSVESLERKIAELDGRIDLATGKKQESYLLKKQSMEARLSWVKTWLEGVDYCLDQMTEDEMTVLNGFFIERKKGHISALSEELGVGASGLYKLREKALTKFAKVMFGGVEI
ncbi:MAG: hypothetical protein IKZ19_06515 [Clostridia bacterium]|nr:hypothetical protein [Clostridia bacterium]